MNIKQVAMIGAGVMGHGIAQVVATAGFQVKLYDVSESILANAKSRIGKSLDRGVQKGKITERDKKEILHRILHTTDLSEAAKDVDLVIEAAPEQIALKNELFIQLDEITKPETILSTNTSQYSITEIASAVKNPSRVIGMHWFNPPVAMKLIEIIKGLDTSEETLNAIRSFTEAVGKDIVVCKDSQGFISTRILLALRLECYRVLEEGLATKEDIDKTLKLAFGHPMGQFELADFSGLDIELPSCESLRAVFGDRFRPTQSLVHRVRSGRFGRKTGRGWYEHNT